MKKAKFTLGQKVRIVKILNDFSSKKLIGVEGIIDEVDPLPNGDYNYSVSGHYMHEDELEAVDGKD